jgi:hypothetical protein
VAVFDPPYQTDSGKDAVIGNRFGSYGTLLDLKVAVQAGVMEAARVSRIGLVVKCMDYIHASQLVRMTRWIEDALALPLYDWVLLESPSKVEDPKWARHGGQLSVRSAATSWLVYRHDGPIHKRRTAVERPSWTEPRRRPLARARRSGQLV